MKTWGIKPAEWDEMPLEHQYRIIEYENREHEHLEALRKEAERKKNKNNPFKGR